VRKLVHEQRRHPRRERPGDQRHDPRGTPLDRHCPLAARGYSRDGKKGRLQIEYGLLTDPAGRPVAVRVFPGNTGDPGAFTGIVKVVRDKFNLREMVMVGDRGMITSARIRALNQREDGTQRPDARYELAFDSQKKDQNYKNPLTGSVHASRGLPPMAGLPRLPDALPAAEERVSGLIAWVCKCVAAAGGVCFSDGHGRIR